MFLREMKPLGLLGRALLGSEGWGRAQGHSMVRTALSLEPGPPGLSAHPELPRPGACSLCWSVQHQRPLDMWHLICKVGADFRLCEVGGGGVWD